MDTLSVTPHCDRRRVLAAAVLLIVTVIIAYIPAMRGGFIWDDDDYVTQNPTLTTLFGLGRIWFEPTSVPQYYPLVHTTFWIERHLWGLNPIGYHVVNVILHIGAALLLWKLLGILEVPGAWLAAAIFALHPVQVESVAWITERKNVLSGLFYFASAIAYLRFEISDLKSRNRHWYAISLALFLCALLSKTVTATLPAAILVIIWWKRGRITPRDVMPLIPFFIVGIGFGAITAHLERTTVGADGAEWALTFSQRALLASRALWFIAGKLLWPSRLTFIYPRWDVRSFGFATYLLPVAIGCVMALLALLRRRVGRAPLAAVLIFGGTLLPALGFLNVYPMRYSFVADHFQYLASVALIALAAAGAWRALAHMPAPQWRVAGTAALLLPLAALTWNRGFAYRDLPTLWTDTISKNPSCWMAHNNLASYLFNAGDTDGAMSHVRESLRIRPDHAEARANLGRMLARQGRTQDAIDCYAEALRLKPKFAAAHLNWGTLDARAGRLDRAAEHFAAAARIRPRYADPHFKLGGALAAQHKYSEAIPPLRQALHIDPLHAEARLQLAAALLATGDTPGATACLEEGVRLLPEHAELTGRLAVVLASSPSSGGSGAARESQLARAIALAQRACELSEHRDAELLGNLAALYASARRFNDAARAAREASAAAHASNHPELAAQIDRFRQSLPAVKPPSEKPSPQPVTSVRD
jgi:tetratricopeptide (TPR) repeat protein